MKRRPILHHAIFITALACLSCLLPNSVLSQDAAALKKADPASKVSGTGSGKTVRLLTIGNSFSANATRYLGDLVQAGGHTLVHRFLVIGGASMQVHWDKAMLHEKNPQDAKGLYTFKQGLPAAIASNKWDYVTIQQASIKSHDLSTYQPYANQLRDYVKKHAPQSTLLVHETWAYRKDDPRFSVKAPKPGEPRTQKEMYEMLQNAYRTIAKELGASIIPSGDALYLADTDAKWGFTGVDAAFDPKKAKNPALPAQTHSLHVGWSWRKGKDGKTTLGMDGHHANMAGEYLGACVFYEVLFGESAVGNSFVPKGLDAEYAKFLQETAHKAVSAEKERVKSRAE
ncbi:uncharacterized protein DUF4886 [Roseimicrobium gellanilyticum]|uniref:Uncharacterized protein DUF4886 n=1 Tax=Roseimicrobium gellanilyticum TaxID=748857 RepID=A0A366HMF7_9BACT|nr:DUF4886 domain-containing protein [Roseimicrobium gellanilyticum]RBP44342.1 uncharacterized protein DUF4886 [Roseimicrobium gellanilyticum]